MIRALRDGRYTEALTISAGLPADADVLFVRGRAFAAIGRYDDAAAAFQPIAQRDPSGEARSNLATFICCADAPPRRRRVLEPRVAAAARSERRRRGAGPRGPRGALGLAGTNRPTRCSVTRPRSLATIRPLQITWGELFLDKQNRAEAVRSFRAALQSDRRNRRRLCRSGTRVCRREQRDRARAGRARALSLNPSLVPAYLVLADLALDEDHRDEARSRRSSRRWTSTRRASRHSAARRRSRCSTTARRTSRRWSRQVLAINPRYGDVYRVAGAQAARHYRFEAAAELARKALQIDPDNVARLGRSRHAPAAHRRRARTRAPRWTRRSAPIPTTSSPTTCSGCSTPSTSSRPSTTAS